MRRWAVEALKVVVGLGGAVGGWLLETHLARRCIVGPLEEGIVGPLEEGRGGGIV